MARLNAAETQVYDRIRSAIGDRQLLPGQRLREVELCRIFDTTRGTIRKVLARLAFDGLVDHQPNRGASVAQPTVKDAADLFVARHCIERAIAREAAARIDDASAAHLRAHIDKERAAHDAGDRQRMIALSGEFHLLLAQISGNTVLRRYLADLVARESLIIQLYEKPDQGSCSHGEHAGIVEALLAGNEAALDAVIAAHIDGIASSLDLEPVHPARPSLEEVFGSR
ncbi:GntR family transcriptional regulator [Mesobacterium pallidum]|uniref:GntR family transcriptional regulator n=1 Tax=Mesobacterium pallidum TaxID=2872037 RepID=UPI001EE172FE|nr:GntR family transcriptional regulator [Mesobacterium pallidum]